MATHSIVRNAPSAATTITTTTQEITMNAQTTLTQKQTAADAPKKVANLLHLNVTTDGLSHFEIERLASESGKKAIYRTAIFSATQSLLSTATAFQKFSAFCTRLETQGLKAKAADIRSTERYMGAEEKLTTVAQRLACLDAQAQSRGYNIDVEISPIMGRLTPKADMEAKAAFAGVDVAYVVAIEQKQAASRYQAQAEATTLAEEWFYRADTEEQVIERNADNEEFVLDVEIMQFFRPESALKDLHRTRDFLLSWNNPDFAELGCLRADIEALEMAVARFEERTEYAGEGSRKQDDIGLTQEDMAQAGAVKAH